MQLTLHSHRANAQIWPQILLAYETHISKLVNVPDRVLSYLCIIQPTRSWIKTRNTIELKVRALSLLHTHSPYSFDNQPHKQFHCKVLLFHCKA